MTTSEQEIVASVDDIPICPGCGFAAHITHGDVCVECFNRREGWLGGGMTRVVTENDTYHETATCPGLEPGTTWWHWRDETCCYADLGGDLDKCHRCHSFRTFGFDHYDEDSVVVGHA